jgi:hypothetical protein
MWNAEAGGSVLECPLCAKSGRLYLASTYSIQVDGL